MLKHLCPTHPPNSIYLSPFVQVFQDSVLNGFMALGQPAWSEARQVIQKLLSKDEVS